MEPVLVSTKHKHVGVPDVEKVRNFFPNATPFEWRGQKLLLVKHLPLYTFMLRRLGYDVPSPILTHYEWPHPPGEPPFHAQRVTAAMLTVSNRAYVLNGMGTGKTRAALWAWDYLYGNKLANKLLVIAPLSTLVFTWKKECFQAVPHRKCVVLHGSKEKRMELLGSDSDIFIINHDGISTIHDAIMDRKDINSVVLDELAVYRNGSAKRTKQMRKMCVPARMQWVWGMTGSPTPKAPTDAWAQCTIVTPHTVPKYYRAFEEELMLRVSPFKLVPKEGAIDKAHKAMQPSVRFTLDDVYELPPAISRPVDVELGPIQKKVYKSLADTCFAAVQNGEVTAANAGAVMSKLLQVSCGWVYNSEGKAVALDNGKRLDTLMDIILESDRKVLVFAPFKHALAGISDALTKEGFEHAVVSGDTPIGVRSELFNLFQNTNKYKVLAAHPRCLAHGITLTAANTIVWFGPIADLEIHEQANARISRVGQKYRQLVLHLQGTPVEKHIIRMLRDKQAVQNQLLNLFEIATQELATNA